MTLAINTNHSFIHKHSVVHHSHSRTLSYSLARSLFYIHSLAHSFIFTHSFILTRSRFHARSLGFSLEHICRHFHVFSNLIRARRTFPPESRSSAPRAATAARSAPTCSRTSTSTRGTRWKQPTRTQAPMGKPWTSTTRKWLVRGGWRCVVVQGSNYSVAIFTTEKFDFCHQQNR
jgi:hypothetical protein